MYVYIDTYLSIYTLSEKQPESIPEVIRFGGLQTSLDIHTGLGYVCKSGRCLRECKIHWMIKVCIYIYVYTHTYIHNPSYIYVCIHV